MQRRNVFVLFNLFYKTTSERITSFFSISLDCTLPYNLRELLNLCFALSKYIFHFFYFVTTISTTTLEFKVNPRVTPVYFGFNV